MYLIPLGHIHVNIQISQSVIPNPNAYYTYIIVYNHATHTLTPTHILKHTKHYCVQIIFYRRAQIKWKFNCMVDGMKYKTKSWARFHFNAYSLDFMVQCTICNTGKMGNSFCIIIFFAVVVVKCTIRTQIQSPPKVFVSHAKSISFLIVQSALHFQAIPLAHSELSSAGRLDLICGSCNRWCDSVTGPFLPERELGR